MIKGAAGGELLQEVGRGPFRQATIDEPAYPAIDERNSESDGSPGCGTISVPTHGTLQGLGGEPLPAGLGSGRVIYRSPAEHRGGLSVSVLAPG